MDGLDGKLDHSLQVVIIFMLLVRRISRLVIVTVGLLSVAPLSISSPSSAKLVSKNVNPLEAPLSPLYLSYTVIQTLIKFVYLGEL